MAKSVRPMSKGQKVRVELNRKAFHEIDLADTDGLMAVAEEVIRNARPPDAPPYGKGLLQGGGWLAYLGGKKIGGQMQDGRNVSKPRSLRDTTQVAIAGWGFPGRFVELGTVDTPAEPFLTRSVMEVEPHADVVISKRIQGRLQGLRDPQGRAPLERPVIDYFGKALDELRDDVGVAAITSRVRGHVPGPDDAKGPGEYIPFVVVIDLGGAPLTKVPVQFPRVVVRCYGVTPQGAKALYVACSNALHDVGPRTVGTVGFYRSRDATGGEEGSDPRTNQPYVEFTAEYIATTAAVA